MKIYPRLSSISQRFPLFRAFLSDMARSSDDPEPIDHLAYSYGAASGYLQALHDLERITDAHYDYAVQELLDLHDSLLADL